MSVIVPFASKPDVRSNVGYWGVKRTRFYVFEYLTETFHAGISSRRLYVLKPA